MASVRSRRASDDLDRVVVDDLDFVVVVWLVAKIHEPEIIGIVVSKRIIVNQGHWRRWRRKRLEGPVVPVISLRTRCIAIVVVVLSGVEVSEIILWIIVITSDAEP